MKRSGIQYFTLFLGCLLAMVIVCSHVFAHQLTLKAKAQTETNDEKSSEEQATISLPSFSLPTPVHVEISLGFHCLFEIAFDVERGHTDVNDSPTIPQKLFTRLFRVIIAPNAP